MAKYYIDCVTAGFIDCKFRTEADTVEKVVEDCAIHARAEHGLRGFGPEVFAKMRPLIKLVENDQFLHPQT